LEIYTLCSPESSVSIFMPNKRLVNSGNRALLLVYLFLRFYHVNLQTEVVKIYLP